MRTFIARVLNALLRPLGLKISALGYTPAAPIAAHSLEFFPYFIDKEIEGVKFKFFIGDTDGRAWYHLSATDPHWPEMKFMRDAIVAKDDVVFECGSHHGCTTVLLSAWAGAQGKVLAFEPNPANFEIAKINVNVNHCSNVEMHHNVVGSATGSVMLNVGSSNSAVVLDGGGSKNLTKVESVVLDSFAHLKPTVLKIDVEGFEKDVLVGAKKILETKPKLAIEVHTEALPEFNTSVEELFDLINRDHYNFWVQWGDDEAPRPYHFDEPINRRVHLFGVPK